MPAFLFMLFVAIAGPGIMDGGFQKIKEKGLKPAIEKAWDNRKPPSAGND